jgi:hypothetical protein
MGTRFPEDPRAPVASGAEGEGVSEALLDAIAADMWDWPSAIWTVEVGQPDVDGRTVHEIVTARIRARLAACVAALAPRRVAPAELGEGCTCDGSPWCTVHPHAPAEPTASTAGEGVSDV